jgi:hypothetical protein
MWFEALDAPRDAENMPSRGRGTGNAKPSRRRLPDTDQSPVRMRVGKRPHWRDDGHKRRRHSPFWPTGH